VGSVDSALAGLSFGLPSAIQVGPPKQWQLIFDRNMLAQEVPVPMTLPNGQNVKAAIYSRFPQLAPAHPISEPV